MAINREHWEGYAFVGLGANLPSNLGDPRQSIVQAFGLVEALGEGQAFRSSLWQSDPLDCPPGSPPYINAVIAVRPALADPLEFLKQLQSIEQEVGRIRSGVVNEPRVLDLDLIAFLGMTHDTAFLRLPHPRARDRKFVLEPLAEIAPQFRFPGEDKSVVELSSALSGQTLLRVS